MGLWNRLFGKGLLRGPDQESHQGDEQSPRREEPDPPRRHSEPKCSAERDKRVSEAVARLLDRKAALGDALSNGDVETVKLLATQDADLVSALLEAAEHGLDTHIETLIRAGADIRGTDSRDNTVLHYAIRYLDYISNKQQQALDHLQQQAEIRGSARFLFSTEYQSSMAKNNDSHLCKVIQLLLKSGAVIDAKNSNGETALIAAVERRAVEAVRVLLYAGANPDYKINYFSARDIAREWFAKAMEEDDNARSQAIIRLLEGVDEFDCDTCKMRRDLANGDARTPDQIEAAESFGAWVSSRYGYGNERWRMCADCREFFSDDTVLTRKEARGDYRDDPNARLLDCFRMVLRNPSSEQAQPVSGESLYMECPPFAGSAVCSDRECPCDETAFPPAQGYLFISEQLAKNRADCLTLAELCDKNNKLASNLSASGMRGVMIKADYPLVLCEQGARLRHLDLTVAAADFDMWVEKAKVPCRATPTKITSRPVPGEP